MLCSYTLYVTKNLMNFYRVKIKIWDWDLRFNMYMDSCYINAIILLTSGILSFSVLPHKRNFERFSQGSWARGYNSTILDLELCLTHWSASLRLSCVYRARRKHTNWAVYCCSTKDSILGHVDVSQELSIFHALVVHFHSAFSVFNFRITLSQADESSSVSLERDYGPVFVHQFQVPWDTA